MDEQHEYQISGCWTSAQNGVLKAEAIHPAIRFSAPPEFHGQAGVWTPEHLLAAAVTSCFITTFRAIAESSRFEYLALDVASRALIERTRSGWRLAEIVIEPTVAIFRDEDYGCAIRLLEITERACLIARSLNCTLTMAPLVRLADEILVS